ncbi:MAG: flagellar assembly protein FliW [Oscillospiraceae bacterium]|nr:flagellar assembly protein FliW [Oscillospiraceae bacterium]
MKVNTKFFGEIEVSEKDIITFDQPVFGFEDKKRYVFMMDDSLNGEFIWLQCIDDSTLCFVLANPNTLNENYSPTFSEEISSVIGKGTYEMWLVMVVADNFGESTVNLKSPIIVNLDERRAAQMIAEEDYTIRYRLFENVKED